MSVIAPSSFQPNVIYCGDCFEVMTQNIPSNSVDLIYIDPPFGSGEDYEIVFKDGVEVRHFTDRWIGGKEGYLNWIKPRVREIHRVLKETGSFYLHCDWHLNAHLRLACDDIFGERYFQNEIIWKRKDAQSFTKKYGVVTDSILFYTKSKDYTWNTQYTPLSQETADSWYSHYEKIASDVINRAGALIPKGTDRRYNLADLSAPGNRAGTLAHYAWKEKYPPKGRHWAYVKDTMEKLEKEGRIEYSSSGKPYEKRYLDESKGVPLQSLWSDISMLRGMSKHQKSSEYQGFPTQKPVALLERIVSVSSNKGDLVLDPMCGCGTTLMASQNLGRNWIGIDISPTSCKLMVKRLQKVNVKIGYDDIIGLPRRIHEIKKMVDLDPIEFQNWVCEKLGAVSTTLRGSKPRADGNIDGWILSTIPIQIKGSDAVGYSEIERFEKTLKKQKTKEGLFVAFSFSKPAYAEAQRARDKDGLNIDLIELEERSVPNEKFPNRPERYTILKSDITKKEWGSRKQ